LASRFLCIRTDYFGRRFSQHGSARAGTWVWRQIWRIASHLNLLPILGLQPRHERPGGTYRNQPDLDVARHYSSAFAAFNAGGNPKAGSPPEKGGSPR
jgi:hypothetical protein